MFMLKTYLNYPQTQVYANRFVKYVNCKNCTVIMSNRPTDRAIPPLKKYSDFGENLLK